MQRIGIVRETTQTRARAVTLGHRALLMAGLVSLLLLVSMLVNAAVVG